MSVSDTTVGTLMKLFSEDMNVDVPSAEIDLIETGIMDSMMLVDLLFQIEARFNISIPLEELDMDNLRSVQSIAAYIDGRVAEGVSA
jgi:D-alanine--poly(phosphoribitol) ligase subunit 2